MKKLLKNKTIPKNIILNFGDNPLENQNHQKIIGDKDSNGSLLLKDIRIFLKTKIKINKEINENNKTVECDIFLVKNSVKLKAKDDESSFSIFNNNQSIDNFYKESDEIDESDEIETDESDEKIKLQEIEKEKNEIKQTIEKLIGNKKGVINYYIWRICNIDEKFDNFENLIIRDQLKIDYCNKNSIKLFIIKYNQSLIEFLENCEGYIIIT